MSAARSTVIAYHAVGDCSAKEDRHNLFVSVDAFAAQMDYLARRRNVVGLDDVAAARIGGDRPTVAITFDDGYTSVLRSAGPILKRHGFCATVFVPTAWIGRTNGWIEPTSCDVQIMDTDELRAAESAGISVESHGHAHIDYSAASIAEVRNDVEVSTNRILEVVGRRPQFFAYPYGNESRTAQQVVAGAGMKAAFTIDAPHDGPFSFARVQITPMDGPRLFAMKTSGRYSELRNSRPVVAAYSVVRPVVRRLMGARDGGKA